MLFPTNPLPKHKTHSQIHTPPAQLQTNLWLRRRVNIKLDFLGYQGSPGTDMMNEAAKTM